MKEKLKKLCCRMKAEIQDIENKIIELNTRKVALDDFTANLEMMIEQEEKSGEISEESK